VQGTGLPATRASEQAYCPATSSLCARLLGAHARTSKPIPAAIRNFFAACLETCIPRDPPTRTRPTQFTCSAETIRCASHSPGVPYRSALIPNDLTRLRRSSRFESRNACSHSAHSSGIFLPYSPRRTGCGEYCPMYLTVFYSTGNSGMAAPSFRGSEAPKLTPFEKSRRTTCPPPMAEEKAPISSILWPFAVSSSRTF